MAKPRPEDHRHAYRHGPSGVMGIILTAFGIALLLGLTSGIVWILYRLF
jgi:hypothetical protein